MKIVQLKTPLELQTLVWKDGTLAPLDEVLPVLDRGERETVLLALERRRRESLARRVASYFARATRKAERNERRGREGESVVGGDLVRIWLD